jgi:predicted GNAT family N-acyltransferase
MEKIITQIDQQFLYKVFSLENDPKRHDYNQEEIDLIIERTLKIIEDNNLSDDFSLMCQIEGSLQLYGDFKSGPDRESITDKSYRALLRLSNKYPRAAHALENLFGQNHTVQPRVLFGAISEIYWDPKYDTQLKSELIYSLQYILSFGGENYVEDIIKKLDFGDKQNYIKIASFLELIKKVATLGAKQDYSGGRILNVIEEALTIKQQEQKGSYLLNIRLQQVLEMVKRLKPDEINFSDEYDRVPFVASDNIFGWHIEDGLMFSNPDDFEKIKDLKNKLLEIEKQIQSPQYLIDQAIEGGQHSVMFTADPVLSGQRSKLYNELSEFFNTPVSEHVISGIKADSEEKRRIEIFDYSYLMKKPIREYIEKDFGFELNALSIKEQFYFLELIKSKTENEILEVKFFVKKYQTVGFKTFLSLEQDPTLGDKIISFGENVDLEIAQKVFEKYSEVVDQAFKIEDFIDTELASQNIDSKQKEEIRNQIMVRAKDVLIQFIDAASFAKEKGIELSGDEVNIQLEQIKTDVILLASTLRSMKRAGQRINLEDIKNFSLAGHVSALEIKEEDRSEMLRIYKENYKDFPELQKLLVASNEKALKSNSSEFTMLRYKEELTGFYRLDHLSSDEVHFAAFNIDAEFRGAGLGEAMMLEDLDQLAREKKIQAETNSVARISSNYIERGFVAVGQEQIGEILALKIIRDDAKFNFESKKLSQEEIVQRYLQNQLNPGAKNLTIICAEKQTDFDFEKMLADGQNIITRYFKFGEKDKEKWYVVLEKRIDL